MTRNEKLIAWGLVALIVALILWTFRDEARAQAACKTHAEIAAFLKTNYVEEVIAGGTALGNQLVAEFWLSPAGTWTLTLTNAQGCTMIHAGGEDWSTGAPLLPGQRDS